ncbi:MAG: transcriptional activator NhaR [Deltaproteobacteria bacterium]|nr:transcriptional activator NhaR [Deltaproteobacteria bacterium]
MEWLNYHHLFYFWTVMHEGSMTAACKRLRLSPSTVSTQVGNLEETLGGKLFRRVGRDLEPTELGHLIFRYANEIFSLGREMMDTVRGRATMSPLPLRAGVVNVLPKLIACKLLEPALSLPERVHMICHQDKEERLLSELAMHNLDLILSDSPVRKHVNIKVYNHLLGECGITFLASKKLCTQFQPAFPESLDNAPMLLPLDMTTVRQGLERWFESLHLRPMIAAEFEDSALMEKFGQKGYGIFAVPSVIEKEVQRQYDVNVVGRTHAVRERFYAVSYERIIKHPAVTAITNTARRDLFAGLNRAKNPDKPIPHPQAR